MLLIVFFCFCLICLYKIEFYGKGYNYNYLQKYQTTSIKGIFIVIIVFSHMNSYIEINTCLNSLYLKIITMIGQLMVTMFLFYSGYGIMESIKVKNNYIHSFFKNRILKTLIHFDLAIILFLLLNLILKEKYSFTHIILSFLGWESVGNSNWFVFCILINYIITLISFMIFKNKNLLALIAITVMSIVYIMIMHKLKEPWWYNIELCFALGLWYSYYKEKIENILLNNKKYWVGLVFIMFLTFLFYKLNFLSGIIYVLFSCCFTLLVIFINIKVSVNNKILYWLGLNSFSIYILQRLPMLLLAHFNLNSNIPIFALTSIIVVLAIASLFTKLLNWVDLLIKK